MDPHTTTTISTNSTTSTLKKKLAFKIPAMPAKLGSIFPGKSQPVFNRPVCTERRHRISRVLYAVFLVLLVIFSCVVIGLKSMTVTFIEDNRETGFLLQSSDPEHEPILMAALPKMLFYTPAKLALVAAALGVFVGLGHLVFVTTDWKTGQKTQSYAFRRNIMFVHFTNSIVILFALVSLYVTHKSSSHLSENYIDSRADKSRNNGTRYNIGIFDLETWSCEWKVVPGASMVKEDYSKQCDLEMAGRAVMIPYVIVGFLIMAVSVAGMVGTKRDANGERIKTEDVGLEMHKFNAT